MSVQLTKHHGLGNDFLVALNPGRPLVGADATAWCARHRGIGADGLIIGTTDGPGRWSMVLFNADGSRAEISGNGIRCLGQAIAMDVGATEPITVAVSTDAGERKLAITPQPGGTAQVRVEMGSAGDGPQLSDRWSELAVAVQQQVSVDLGNPHLVALVDELDGYDIAAIGPVVEADYPQGCNVHLVMVAGPDRIKVVHWERGVGVTEACGSGATAAAVAANRWELVGDLVTVDMPGGSAQVGIGDPLALWGPATFIARIEVPNG